MKKTALLFLIISIFMSVFVTSCADNNDTLGSVSSGVASYEEVSSTIKTDINGNFTFEFDPYVLPKSVIKAIGGNEEYVKLVDAILGRQSSVSVSSQNAYDNLRFAIDECFVLSFLVKEFDYDSENNLILISYNFSDTHNEKIDEVKTAVNEILTASVEKNDKNALAAISVYSYLAQNISLDGKTLNVADDDTSSQIAQTETENETLDLYSTLINKKSNSQLISKLYSFLLMQLGIDSKTVGCWQNNEYITFNLINLDNKWFFCDINAEQSKTEGKGLKFFGMNTKRLEGYITAKEIYTGQYNWFTSDLPAANSKRFNDLQNVISWEVSSQRSAIDAFTEEYSRIVFKF